MSSLISFRYRVLFYMAVSLGHVCQYMKYRFIRIHADSPSGLIMGCIIIITWEKFVFWGNSECDLWSAGKMTYVATFFNHDCSFIGDTSCSSQCWCFLWFWIDIFGFISNHVSLWEWRSINKHARKYYLAKLMTKDGAKIPHYALNTLWLIL